MGEKQVRIIIAGAGNRGAAHAAFAKSQPERMKIVGVAEPREYHRTHMASEFDIPAECTFSDWREMAAVPKFADAVVIATQDADHVEPTLAFAEKGYHIMLEKPVAPTPEECVTIVEGVKAAGVMFSVGHVLRYTPYTKALKALVDEGAVGEIVSMNRIEPLGYWHQAHSYVRGNWRNEDESSFMLLAKSCHDLDWMHYIMGRRCTAVSSFGSLKHFRPENRPEGAADRCLDCSVEATCPYSAVKIYCGRFERGEREWPVEVVAPNPTKESLLEALRTGPYGRCVYACDNDVVDNQVVNMEFEGGATACFTMTAFNEANHRSTRIFGTRGEIQGNGNELRVFDFMTDTWRDVPVPSFGVDIEGGHGGGDYGLMDAFVAAIAQDDPSLILSGPDDTLDSHLMVFAAERARLEHCVVDL